jgi:hypothetical protein
MTTCHSIVMCTFSFHISVCVCVCGGGGAKTMGEVYSKDSHIMLSWTYCHCHLKSPYPDVSRSVDLNVPLFTVTNAARVL